VKVATEPHVALKRRVPGAIGVIRTADTTQYANMVLVSG
jgi:D-ribose pyranase